MTFAADTMPRAATAAPVSATKRQKLLAAQSSTVAIGSASSFLFAAVLLSFAFGDRPVGGAAWSLRGSLAPAVSPAAGEDAVRAPAASASDRRLYGGDGFGGEGLHRVAKTV